MSHYAVAVFHREDQDIDDLLAPYDENIEVDPYIVYTKEEAIKYMRKRQENNDKTDEECWKILADDYNMNVDMNGNIYSTYNPESKWDWYVEGGRFGGSIKTKYGAIVDSARVKDIDFSPDKKEYGRAFRWWEVVIDHKEPKNAEEKEYKTFYSEEYLKKRYKNADMYARTMSSFGTYAVVTPDGEWHAVGEMGWWGTSSETHEEAQEWYCHYKERFIDTANTDWILTVVDCHI